MQTHIYQGDKLTVTSGKRAYDAVKARWEQESLQQNRRTCYWLLLVIMGFALLLSDVVLLLTNSAVTIEYVVSAIVASSTMVQGNFKSGYLVLPTLGYMLICFMLFLMGRFLQTTSSIKNSKACEDSYNVMLLVFLIYALVGIMVDVLYYKGLSRSLYLIMGLIHVTIYILTLVLLCQTYGAQKRLTVAMKALHDFLIEYRQTPRSKLLRRHLPNMTVVVEEESFMEYSEQSMPAVPTIVSCGGIDSAGSMPTSSFH